MDEFNQPPTGKIEVGQAGLDGRIFVIVNVDHRWLCAVLLVQDGVDLVIAEREGNCHGRGFNYWFCRRLSMGNLWKRCGKLAAETSISKS